MIDSGLLGRTARWLILRLNQYTCVVGSFTQWLHSPEKIIILKTWYKIGRVLSSKLLSFKVKTYKKLKKWLLFELRGFPLSSNKRIIVVLFWVCTAILFILLCIFIIFFQSTTYVPTELLVALWYDVLSSIVTDHTQTQRRAQACIVILGDELV